jgi:hypothetical protein
LTNVSSTQVPLSLSDYDVSEKMLDLITADEVNTSSFTLEPYQYVWLSATDF